MNKICSIIAKVLCAKRIAVPAIDDNNQSGLIISGCDCDYNCDWDIEEQDLSDKEERVLPSAIRQ